MKSVTGELIFVTPVAASWHQLGYSAALVMTLAISDTIRERLPPQKNATGGAAKAQEL
jgi:hypothetical protein